MPHYPVIPSHSSPPIFTPTLQWLIIPPPRIFELTKVLKSNSSFHVYKSHLRVILHGFPKNTLSFIERTMRIYAYSIDFQYRNSTSIFTAEYQPILQCSTEITSFLSRPWPHLYLILSLSLSFPHTCRLTHLFSE